MTTINVPSIADIKKHIKESKAKTTQYRSTVDKSFFPFWKMDATDHATVRLIPDINSENPMPFYIDSFNHVVSIDGNDRKIACPKTFDRTTECPICDLSQKYYREGDKEKGRYYWRNKNSFTRVLVLENPLDVKDENGETVDYVGNVCTSTFGKQILQSIEEALSEFDNDQPVPWLIEDGYDFIIKKVQMGAGEDVYMTYSFSKFANKSSGIPEQYRDSIELIDYRDMLPDRPALEKVQNYLDAHLGQAEFQFAGGNKKSETPAAEAAVAAVAPVAPVAAPVAEAAPPAPPAVPRGDSPADAVPTAPVVEVAPAAEIATAPVEAGVTALNDETSDEDMIAKILNRQS